MLSEVSVEVQTQTLPTVEVVVHHSGPTAIYQPNNQQVAEVGHSIDNQALTEPFARLYSLLIRALPGAWGQLLSSTRIDPTLQH